MNIRTYRSKDCREIIKLFYETVHSVNCKDYTKEQLDAWAPENINLNLWDKSLSSNYALVFTDKDIIVGFGDLNSSGYFDRLYVHKNYQGKGIAAKIADSLETYAKNIGLKSITTQASITAKPFFKKRGYIIIKSQHVERKGQFLTNYIMEKVL